MARRPESSQPISQVETQREGIMYEGLHSALGGIAVASRTLSTSSAPTAKGPQGADHAGETTTAVTNRRTAGSTFIVQQD